MSGAGTAWSRPFRPEARADRIWPEPKSAQGPRTSGAAQKSGGPATRIITHHVTVL